MNLISLQVVHHREYAVKARSIQEVVVEIPAPRGTIFDRDGRPLAMSLASRSIFINPMKVDVGVASDLLGYLLHMDRAELYLKIKQAADAHRGYLTIKRKLTSQEYDNLLSLKSSIDWINLSHESQRTTRTAPSPLTCWARSISKRRATPELRRPSTPNCAALPD